ncbi:hypothetical protein FAVG1_11847 [Fusarium avenaceum]|nr:hypothetical protein FAVG1_11847 [Fusarium avenaceum]
MAEQRRDSIAEDWLEIESAASVISFDSISRPTTPSPPSPPSPVLATQPIESHNDLPPTTTSELPVRLKEEDPEIPTAPKESPPDSTPSQDPDAQHDVDLADPTPADYHKACQSATEALATVATMAYDLGGHRISTMSLLRSTCEQLSTQTEDLGKMLEVYAAHWVSKGSNMSFVDIPLNPEIWDLMSELNTQLLRGQGDLCSLIPSDEDAPVLLAKNIPLHVNLALARCLESLEDTQELFTEFLPILRADFDDFKTRHMGFSPAQDIQSPRNPRRQPPQPSVSRIRRELYDMKDRFVLINVLLSRLKNADPLPMSIDPLLFKSLKGIVESISTLLTNNPSEWIDSDMAPSSPGIISYPQYLTLDPDVLHDITSHLQEFQEELDIEPGHDSCYSPLMIRNHQECLLSEGGKMEELCSVIEFTESLLMMGD